MNNQTRQKPSIAILGAGAMGGLIGGSLSEGGADVTLIDVNAEHVDALRQNGLKLKTDKGERYIPIPVLFPWEVSKTYDLIIVFTKTMHTTSAIAAIRSAIDANTVLLSLQNGLDNKLSLMEFVDHKNIMVGITTYPADMKGPGCVESHGEGIVRLASASTAPPLLDYMPELFARGDIKAIIDPQVEVAIWEKVIFNAALNGLCAVTRSTVGQIGAHADTRELAFQIIGELCATAHACGFAVQGERIEKTVSEALEQHTSHKPSMLQDVLAERPTEIEAICGAAVRRAEEHNIPVPVTRTILGLVRHIDWHL
ncbi:2-dehydropantoate 2-reductase [Halomonas sp. SpR1]|uniref:ketopantoate reductase family protein n=1 Tax=Halomonas sp. SpR1 TaxID=3050462 RepID=UPI0027E5A42A|nr:2-dehydropantoate 2-reductase [Halomonas sp. SpR1]MDQ7734642.1 2-dehydropantoate 2-reductase [Halomonas sp. SpR1]